MLALMQGILLFWGIRHRGFLFLLESGVLRALAIIWFHLFCKGELHQPPTDVGEGATPTDDHVLVSINPIMRQ